jgi:hypothetical protein
MRELSEVWENRKREEEKKRKASLRMRVKIKGEKVRKRVVVTLLPNLIFE